MRAHYPLSTIKEVAARLCKAKVYLFSILDENNKFPESSAAQTVITHDHVQYTFWPVSLALLTIWNQDRPRKVPAKNPSKAYQVSKL